MGSTRLQDPAVDEPSATHYPVDDITEKKNRELHAPMRNISYPGVNVYALPHQPGATFHFGEVPARFARVEVTKVMSAFHSMDLDIPGAEGEKTLGEVKLGIVLWKKQYVKFPDSTTIPPIRNSPHQSPHASPGDWEPTMSPSLAPSHQPTDAPTSNLAKQNLFITSSPVKKHAKDIPKKVKELEKLAAEKTMEELELSTQGEVKAFFEQKKGKTGGKT